LQPVLNADELQELFTAVDAVHLPQAVANYIARLVAATHPRSANAPEPVRNFVRYGSSPRGAIAIGAAARGLALSRGKPNVGFNRTIEIVGRGTRWWNSGDSGTSEIHQSLILKRGDRKRFSIPIPVYANNESVQFLIVERSKTLQSFSFVSLESNKIADEAS